MSEKYRSIALFYLGLFVGLVNFVIAIDIFLESSDEAYIRLLLFTTSFVACCIASRKRYPQWSVFFLALSVFVPICFYLFHSSFSYISLFSIFPLIGVCSYFILGRPAAVLFSLFLIGLAYYATFGSDLPSSDNIFIETLIYYSLLLLTFGVVFFVNLQIKVYESKYYRKQEAVKLESLSKTHKEQVDSIIREIRCDLTDQYLADFKSRSPKGYEAFIRAFGRIEQALDEIHSLSEREEPLVDQKIYRLWEGDDT